MNYHRPPPLAPEGFSSAFGLMTLEDPNVLAGLSNNAIPFFSDSYAHHDPNVTPMPSRHQRNRTYDGTPLHTSVQTPLSSREAETRELREFWKTYMRTPPSLETPGLRRVRVASLPSAKTPTSEQGTQPRYTPNGNVAFNPASSSVRTTLHANHHDDLRSYQAAVLARKTPTLNLVPKKGRGDVLMNHPPSRERSVTRDGSGSDKDAAFRPSFKRLPSQTLGPVNAKRAQLSHDEGDEHHDYEQQGHGGDGGGGDADTPLRSIGDGNPGNISKMLSGFHHSTRPVVHLTERRLRRMSAPTAPVIGENVVQG
jgi:hypothetical protein